MKNAYETLTAMMQAEGHARRLDLMLIIRSMVNKSASISREQAGSLEVLLDEAIERFNQLSGQQRAIPLFDLALPVATWLNTCHE
jgi:hypothetical protein